MVKVSYHVMRNRVMEADIEELIEALDLSTEQFIELIEEAGHEGMIEKMFLHLEGEGNVTNNNSEEEDA